jgi:hypothetical protein
MNEIKTTHTLQETKISTVEETKRKRKQLDARNMQRRIRRRNLPARECLCFFVFSMSDCPSSSTFLCLCFEKFVGRIFVTIDLQCMQSFIFRCARFDFGKNIILLIFPAMSMGSTLHHTTKY